MTNPYPRPHEPEPTTEPLIEAMRRRDRQHRRLVAIVLVGMVTMNALLLWRAQVGDQREAERRTATECALKATEGFEAAVSRVLVLGIVPTGAQDPEAMAAAIEDLRPYADGARSSTLECLNDD